MPISTTPPTVTHSDDFSGENNIEDINFDQLLNDITKAEDALNDLDGRLDNFNAKADAMLLNNDNNDSFQKKSYTEKLNSENK
ncbi:4785_t:CDS:2 [Scutellospora calospora]|uniref:4785_t:CDS:1 n=1 Tax=Scutellospora calospora TaxID=85575 RepID=A0ACA9MIB3_9GLOM|nr:4785_t:CDS:2 [Scutellospora calospora]